jgi:hypothetical protein
MWFPISFITRTFSGAVLTETANSSSEVIFAIATKTELLFETFLESLSQEEEGNGENYEIGRYGRMINRKHIIDRIHQYNP